MTSPRRFTRPRLPQPLPERPLPSQRSANSFFLRALVYRRSPPQLFRNHLFRPRGLRVLSFWKPSFHKRVCHQRTSAAATRAHPQAQKPPSTGRKPVGLGSPLRVPGAPAPNPKIAANPRICAPPANTKTCNPQNLRTQNLRTQKSVNPKPLNPKALSRRPGVLSPNSRAPPQSRFCHSILWERFFWKRAPWRGRLLHRAGVSGALGRRVPGSPAASPAGLSSAIPTRDFRGLPDCPGVGGEESADERERAED